MRYARSFKRLLATSVVLLTVACGGGGSGTSSSGDISNQGERADALATGLDRFLLFPNPLARADGVFESNTQEYADAYYAAIDPGNAKDTLAKWKQANNFGVTTGGHSEVFVVFGDQRDLGYGRRMTAHRSPDGTMAFMVENYQAGAYGDYSPLNLDAAVNRVSQWHLGTNAIEYSPGPLAGQDGRPAGANFVKFYTFDPATGARVTMRSFDGRPAKAMPTVCVSCHGGRSDPLTPPVAGKRLFALVVNGVSQHRGDVLAKLHLFEPATFDYPTLPGLTRADQEASIKAINQMVLCSYPLAKDAVATLAEDLCRPASSTFNEYQGTAAVHLKELYGGDGLPNASASTFDSYVEPSWVTAGQSALYTQVQAPTCRVCHLLMGTGNQSDIDFETFAKFDGFSDRTKIHMVDRGNMPLSKILYDRFFSTPSMFQTLGSYLVAKGFPDGGLMPGRPIADPGPDRVVKPNSATQLSAAMSLYASSYRWSLVGGPAGGASLANAATAQATFSASIDGSYQVQLVATNDAGRASAPATLTIVVDSKLPYDPAALRFAQVKDVLKSCAGCHSQRGGTTPIWFSDDERRTGTETSNDHWFYTELRGRINFTDIVASPLLRKPSGNHHAGGKRTGFDGQPPYDANPPQPPLAPGAAGRSDYDLILNWILNGAPE